MQLKFFKFRQLSQLTYHQKSKTTKLSKLESYLDDIPYRVEVGSSWEDIKEADYGSEEADVIPEIQNDGN